MARQDSIAYSAPGRTFDWKHSGDKWGKTKAGMNGLTAAFDRLVGPTSNLNKLVDAIADMARDRGALAQSDYALVDAEGGAADATEEEEGH